MSYIRWHIGCSGFHYKEWKESFYPKKLPQRLWFEFYCRRGVPKLYYSLYEENFLQHVAAAITNAKHVKQAYLYLNNTAGMGAVENARYLQQLISK